MIRQVSKNRLSWQRTGWHWLAGSFLALVPVLLRAQTPDSLWKRCGTVEHERMLQQRFPDRLRQLNLLNQQLRQAEASGKFRRQGADTTIYRIPVVVHVVHSTASEAIGGANNVNISDAQITSQIQVLNEDYRRKPSTNGYNTSPLGADAGIEFYLARTDPSGNPTNGITRHYYAQKSSFDSESYEDEQLLSQIAYWPSDQYLNIWVTSLQNNILGFTQYPPGADTLHGLQPGTNELIDGSLIDYRVFGRNTGTVRNSLYLLGRTVTHEIGHWLGLYHIWGDNGGCNDDYVVDTPPMEDGTNSPTSCRQTYSNCDGKGQVRDLMEDYMNYWPDACMNLFTQGQVARMRAVLQLSPRRARLIKSAGSPLTGTETLTVNLYPNPTQSDPAVEVQLKGVQTFSVDLFDSAGRQLRALTYTNTPSTRVVLPVAGLAAGIYIIRVKTADETVSKRLLIH